MQLFKPLSIELFPQYLLFSLPCLHLKRVAALQNKVIQFIRQPETVQFVTHYSYMYYLAVTHSSWIPELLKLIVLPELSWH